MEKPKLHDFLGVRKDLYLNLINVNLVKYDENAVLWIIHEKHFNYTTTMKPEENSAKEYTAYEGPRVSIVFNERGEEAAELILLGDEANCFWEYMCEHYEYLGANSSDNLHVSVY